MLRMTILREECDKKILIMLLGAALTCSIFEQNEELRGLPVIIRQLAQAGKTIVFQCAHSAVADNIIIDSTTFKSLLKMAKYFPAYLYGLLYFHLTDMLPCAVKILSHRISFAKIRHYSVRRSCKYPGKSDHSF